MAEKIVVSGKKRRDLQRELDALYEALEDQGITLPEVAQKPNKNGDNRPGRLLT